MGRKRSSVKDRPKRAIGYIRVSDRGGRAGPEYHTLDIQRQSIERVCQFREYDLIDVYVEENKSGKDATRPKFREAMSRITEGGEATALAVWKVSRFSRSWTQAAKDFEALQDVGADLLSGEEGFDTASIGGMLLLRILFSIAAWEHDVLTEQWEGIKTRSIERGSHLGRNPFGYLRVAVEPTKPYHVSMEMAADLLDQWATDHDIARNFEPVPGLLVPHAEHGRIVQKVFEMRAAEASWADIVRYLDKECPLPNGGFWPHTNVRRMVTLRTYLGEVKQDGDEIEVHNRSAHPPIVTRDLFRAVEAIEKGMVKRARSEALSFPLSGKVYCAGCSWRMGGGTIPQVRKVWADTGEPVPAGTRTDLTSRAVRDEKIKVRVYRCPGKRGTGRCPAPSVIMADALEAFVAAQVEPAIRAQAATSESEDRSAEMAELDAVIAEADDALMEMASLKKRREFKDDWGRMTSQLRAEKEQLVRERDALSEAAGGGSVRVTDYDALTQDEREGETRKLLGAVFVRKAPRGADVTERARVLFATDELPALGGPSNRIAPTPYVP